MKKLIISITAAYCILLGILLFGKFISLSNNQNISQKIQENLSLDNKNIKAYYNKTEGSKFENLEIDIINESFTDYEKYDSKLLYDEETYYSNINKFIEWMYPQYKELLDEIVNSKYKKIDDINSNDGLVVILKNLDTQFMLYIYKDNKIKIVDDKINGSYQSTTNLTKCYEVFDNFNEKLLNFILNN